MKASLRIVFAAVGSILGLVLGVAIGIVVGYAMISAGAGGTGPDNLALVVVLAFCGAVIGVIAGLVAGIMIPLSLEAKKRHEQAAFPAPTSGEDVWPPPPTM